MAAKMVFFWISLVLSIIIGCNASGELCILYSPQSLKFTRVSETMENFLKEIFAASLGLSVEESSIWNGLFIVDPFNTPEAVVEIHIDGVSSLTDDADIRAKNYPLSINEYEPQLDTYGNLIHRIRQHFIKDAHNLIQLDFSDKDQLNLYPVVFGDISPPKEVKRSLEYLKDNVEEDFQFLNELQALQTFTAQIPQIKPDNIIDFYKFRFGSLHPIVDFHGPYSVQATEAKKVLEEALEELSAAFVKAYDGLVLVTVVTTDVAHTRRTEQTSSLIVQSVANSTVDVTFTPMFNIIFWFSFVFFLSLLAIVYAIMDMDPGRDSIIYRMTSMRIKKDN